MFTVTEDEKRICRRYRRAINAYDRSVRPSWGITPPNAYRRDTPEFIELQKASNDFHQLVGADTQEELDELNIMKSYQIDD